MRALRRTHTSSSSSNSSSPSSSSSSSSSWIHLRSVLFVVASSSPAYSCSPDRGRLKSPWSRKKKKHALSPRQWRNMLTPDGKLRDGGVKLVKKVRSGGVDPSIRAEVWPFLLGVYDLNSSKEERDIVKTQNRKEYEKLRRECRRLLKHSGESYKLKESGGTCGNGENGSFIHDTDSPDSEDVVSARDSSVLNSESSDSDSSEDPDDSSPSKTEVHSKIRTAEDFATWQRIIRVDAVRANSEWIPYSPAQAAVSEGRARCSAEAVGLKDYDHLEPSRIFHAARLVAILEAYALYDPEIGYCQGMSDLLSPIISVILEDHEAFWCFVGFMRKARHNFRLDEIGIRRQLNTVSKIIKSKDSHLYRHLEKLQAEDCFFVYRMVVVLFRRELSFEQTVCLWEPQFSRREN
ncbi:unnamed protein product, partial [Vitis vinifera]